MSNIYSAKFMHEASTTLESKVFKRPVNETYLFSTMNALREMNTMIDNHTKKLYLQINEAESKEDENKLFADYFYQFKSIFQEFSNRLQQMKSRMVISIENKVETWEDLYKDDSYIASFDKEFSCSGYKFSHIEDPDYPRLNLQKLYQKEFDYIGQLMQDTSMSASPSVRLKIIASVCNNFANCSGDKNWIKELIKDMVDIDEKEITRSYSECIYNALRDKYEITVDKGMLYTCKENLFDYEDIIDAASKLCDNLLYDLDKVAENISSYLFRNQDNKLKIKTDTDGVIDRDYRLDTYSMNQLDLFLKNKINQMKKVLNVYSIAVGIKFDTAVDYIDQNIEILKMAKTYDVNEPGSEEDDIDNTDIDNNTDDTGLDNTSTEEPETDDIDEPEDGNDDDFEFGGSDDEDEEPIEEEPEDDYDDFGDFEDEDEEPSMGNDVMNDDSEDFEEAYLFESELFELEMMCNEYEMHQSIREALLLEKDESTSDTQTSDNSGQTTANQTTQNTDNNTSELRKELWERFRKKFLDTTKDKIEFLKKNEKFINTKVTGEVGLKYTPNFALLNDLNIPDLNYANPSFQKTLESEEVFFSTYFSKFYDKNNFSSVTDAIKEKILGQEQNMQDVSTIKPSITEAFEFCKGYEALVNRLNNQMNILNKAEKVARDISKVPDVAPATDSNSGTAKTESAYMKDHNQYFMEFETNTKASDNPEKVNNLKIYFNTCSRVLAAYMTVSHNLFIEMYNYCNWWIMRARGGNVPTQNNDQNNNQTQNNQNQGESK